MSSHTGWRLQMRAGERCFHSLVRGESQSQAETLRGEGGMWGVCLELGLLATLAPSLLHREDRASSWGFPDPPPPRLQH